MEVFTNLHQLNRKSTLRQMGEESSKLRSPFSSDGALLGPLPAYSAPAVSPSQVRQLQELLERQKNWTLTPDDLIPKTSTEDIFTAAILENEKSDQKRSTLEQFLNALKQSERGSANVTRSRDHKEEGMFGSRSLSSRDNSLGLHDDSTVPGTIRNNAESLQKLLSDQPSVGATYNPRSSRGTASDLFGFGQTASTSTREQVLSHKAYIEDYTKKVLENAPYSPIPNPLLDLPGSLPNPSTPNYSMGLDQYSSPSLVSKPESPLPKPTGYKSIVGPVVLPDINAALLNQWNPMYAPPKLESSRPAPASSASATEFPRRRF